MTVQYLLGDCRDVLKTLPSESAHCVVTSPPYWGLRDYGTAKWEGGDPECDHKQDIGARASSTLNGSLAHKDGRIFTPYRHECGKCGARRIDSQIGLEPTFDAFIAEMVSVFREVRRILRKDGTLWLNLGDSYASQGSSVSGDAGDSHWSIPSAWSAGNRRQSTSKTVGGGLKPKDLCGTPWRLAFALQADGWWLRQDIIWAKPNPMPESVTDRCTKAHEYIFLLSKSARYYYDAEAIKEPADIERAGIVETSFSTSDPKSSLRCDVGRSVLRTETRNKRSVWEVATAPFSEAHFATFPPDLIKPCIKAGCPKGGTVLDPFGGSGTVGLVASRLQRNAVLIDLNEKYMNMAKRRIQRRAGLSSGVDWRQSNKSVRARRPKNKRQTQLLSSQRELTP